MKTNVYKPSGKKGAKRSNNKLGNKWFIFGGIILIAIVGIIAIRVSQAAVGVYSGRMPETGEPHINYTVNLNGTVTLTKSTNGESRTAGNIDEAYVIGEQMYNEMIAAQTPPPSTPPSTSTPSNATSPTTSSNSTSSTAPPSTTTTPGSNTNQTSTNQPSSNSTSTSSSSNQNQNNTSTIVRKFLITLRRKVSIVPKIPQNVTEVGSVVLLVDGNKVAESNSSKNLIMLDTTKYSNGTHTLTTQIINKSGSVVSADSYTIKIDNTDSWIDKLLWFFGY